jgi:hypothetical protein
VKEQGIEFGLCFLCKFCNIGWDGLLQPCTASTCAGTGVFLGRRECKRCPWTGSNYGLNIVYEGFTIILQRLLSDILMELRIIDKNSRVSYLGIQGFDNTAIGTTR